MPESPLRLVSSQSVSARKNSPRKTPKNVSNSISTNRSGTPSTAANALSAAQLEGYVNDWVYDSEYRQLSPQTISSRKLMLGKLIWFLQQRQLTHCGTGEIRQFLAYVGSGHRDACGRWGTMEHLSPRLAEEYGQDERVRHATAVRPRTVHTYYDRLRTFSNWLVNEGVLEVSPMAKLKPPVARSDQIQPFTAEQGAALLEAARATKNPKRDELIFWLLWDTGMRASELCALRRKDMDAERGFCIVLGKGDKHRKLMLGMQAKRALWNYLRTFPFDSLRGWGDNPPMFWSQRGTHSLEKMRRDGLLKMVRRWGEAAGIEAVRCSPHTFRHTFAIEFLRDGGNSFALQGLLGHTTLDMVNNYVKLADSDLEAQHRKYSPGDRLGRQLRGKGHGKQIE